MLKDILIKKIRADILFSGTNTFLNLYSIGFLIKSPGAYADFDNLYSDGFLLTFALRVFGIKSTRVSFDYTSAADPVLSWCRENNQTLYVIGSTQESLNSFCQQISVRYPGIIVGGSSSGYFEDEVSKINDIINISPNVVICGMGAPKQDHFLVKLKKAGFQGISYSCGGFIHQTAKSKGDYYPKTVNKLGLRWLYRCLKEPYVIKRYVFDYPKNLATLAKEFLRRK